MTIETINIGTTPNDNTGDDPRTAGQKLNSNFTTSTHAASRDVGTASGNVMEVGAGGLLSNNSSVELPDLDNDATRLNGMFRLSAANTGVRPAGTIHQVLQMFQSSNFGAQLALSGTETRAFLRNVSASTWSDWQELYHSGNLNPNIFRGATNDTIASGFAYSATSTAWSLPILGVSQPISITVSGTFSVRNRVTGAVIAAGIVPTLSAASSYKTLVLDVSGLTVVADTDYSLTADSAASSIEVNF